MAIAGGSSTDARYDAVAAEYAGSPDSYEGEPAASLLSLVGSPAELRVLDLACGHGPFSRWLARRGAMVVGVDLSRELIEHGRARESSEPLGVTYLEADATSPQLLSGKAFDGVVCSFGLTDIDDLDAVVANVARLLRRGGWFAFSILHPCFAGAEQVSGSWPDGATYYDERRWRASKELSTLRRRVGSNHRMISTYVNTLNAAGLRVEQMLEPRPAEEWARVRPGTGAQPVFLVVRARHG